MQGYRRRTPLTRRAVGVQRRWTRARGQAYGLRRRARCVPDRTVNREDSRPLTDTRAPCPRADQRPRTRSLPSWWCVLLLLLVIDLSGLAYD
jgi:hypothetical protein